MAQFFAAARAAATDGPDHLPVHYDRDAARDREEVKKEGRPWQAARIVLKLRRMDGGGPPRLQRGADVVVNMAVHPLHEHKLACTPGPFVAVLL
jgi:hypothetical protein